MIRPMTKLDWPEVKRIYSQSIAKGNATFQAECPTYQYWDDMHKDDCRFVCERDGEIVGFVAIAPTSQRKVFRGVVESSVYVDEKHRRQGIGRELLTALQKETELEGYWTLYAAILRENVPSIELHKSCGFRVIGIREKLAKDKFGEWKDMVVMEYRNENL